MGCETRDSASLSHHHRPTRKVAWDGTRTRRRWWLVSADPVGPRRPGCRDWRFCGSWQSDVTEGRAHPSRARSVGVTCSSGRQCSLRHSSVPEMRLELEYGAFRISTSDHTGSQASLRAPHTHGHGLQGSPHGVRGCGLTPSSRWACGDLDKCPIPSDTVSRERRYDGSRVPKLGTGCPGMRGGLLAQGTLDGAAV